MCLKNNLEFSKGFTMIELLVALVILSAVGALIAPRLMSWQSAREASAIRTTVASEIALLTIQAKQANRAILLRSNLDLNIKDIELIFTPPLQISANGYCHGGKGSLMIGKRQYVVNVEPPFCKVNYE
jgi:prepilin-type N-terminal cleavage/methylation domain-containing protein